MLLVGQRGHDHLAREIEAGGLPAGDQRCGEAGLHVIGTAPVEPVALDPRPVVHPLRGHRVAMPAQQQRPASSLAARSNDDARPSRGRLKDLNVQAGRTSPVGDVRGDLAFARATGYERWVDGVDRDHPGEEIEHGVRHAESVSLLAMSEACRFRKPVLESRGDRALNCGRGRRRERVRRPK